MALTKQQKMDMIYDVELRLAKEELAEQYIRNIKAVEDSEKPLRTLKSIVDKVTPPIVEIERESSVAGHSLAEHQRDEWHSLNERHFEELKLLSADADLHGFAEQNKAELNELLEHHGRDRDRVEQSDNPFETERAILLSYQNTPEPEAMDRMRQNVNHLTSEEKELLEQSEEAVRTSSTKAGLDSLSQWKFIGMETLATQRVAKRDFDIQRDFENAKAMTNDHDMGMER